MAGSTCGVAGGRFSDRQVLAPWNLTYTQYLVLVLSGRVRG
jgi:hypothetical protein